MHRRAATNSVASDVASKPHASADAGIQIVATNADRAATSTVDAGNQRAAATALLALPAVVLLRCTCAPAQPLSPAILFAGRQSAACWEGHQNLNQKLKKVESILKRREKSSS